MRTHRDEVAAGARQVQIKKKKAYPPWRSIRSIYIYSTMAVTEQKSLWQRLAPRVAGAALVCTGVLSAHGLWGQDSTEARPRAAFFVETSLHHGFIIVHSRDIRALEDSYPWGLEVDFGWQRLSSDAWEMCNCYPRMGVSLGAWYLDSPSILGNAYTATFFLEPEFGQPGKVSFSIRGGLGLSYQTRPHDPVENPDNLSYSTLLAFPLQVGGTVRWSVNEHWQLHTSARYNHISNGGMRQPNKGINWPTLAVGFTYFPERKIMPRSKTDWRSLVPPRKQWSFAAFGTYHEPARSVVIGGGGAEVKYSHQVARVNALTGGAEWMVHGSYPYEARQEGGDTHPHLLGLAAGHEFLLGRFLFSQQFGAYLLKPANEPRDVYQRYGIMYAPGGKWAFGVHLKTHGHVADFLDLRVAFIP